MANVERTRESLNPDIPPWERQDNESTKAWTAFSKYLASEDRVVGPESNIKEFSYRWSWRYRALEYDRYLSRVELEDMVRYRRTMNRRHRQTSRALQGKVIEWLRGFDVKTLKASEAIRFFEVAVKIEREAAGLSSADVEAALDALNLGASAHGLNISANDAITDPSELDDVALEDSPEAMQLLRDAVKRLVAE